MKAKLLDLMNQNMKKMIRDIWPNGILLKSNGIQQMVSNPLIVWENAPFWRILLMLWIWNVKMLSVWLSWLVLDHYLSWFCSYLLYSNAGMYIFLFFSTPPSSSTNDIQEKFSRKLHEAEHTLVCKLWWCHHEFFNGWDNWHPTPQVPVGCLLTAWTKSSMKRWI